MGKLPVISGEEMIRKLQRLGYEVIRQRGSHVRLRHPAGRAPVTVPLHKELNPGTLKAIISQAMTTVEEVAFL